MSDITCERCGASFLSKVSDYPDYELIQKGFVVSLCPTCQRKLEEWYGKKEN